jgi:GNAT superfamily N-acetyltransferase
MIARAATLADVTELVRLINLAYMVEAGMFRGDRTNDADVRDRMAKPNAAILTFDDAGSNGRLAGSVYVQMRGDRGYFGMLAVDPSQRGRGLGRALVHAAEEHARSLGCAAMDLDVVHLRRELTTFYGPLGYTAIDEVPYPLPEDTNLQVRLIRMTKPIGLPALAR